MPIIKAKDANGTWMPVANATSLHITNGSNGLMAVTTVRAVDAYTFDLSEYVNPYDKFLFFFKSTTNSALAQQGGELFVLDGTGDTPRKAHWNTNVASMGWFNHPSSMSNSSTLFPDDWQFEGEYDEATCLLTFEETGASTYGILFYVEED